jgi:hypothetical protein
MVRLKRRIATSNGSFSLTRIPGIADFLGCLMGRKTKNINQQPSQGKARDRLPGSAPG